MRDAAHIDELRHAAAVRGVCDERAEAVDDVARAGNTRHGNASGTGARLDLVADGHC